MSKKFTTLREARARADHWLMLAQTVPDVVPWLAGRIFLAQSAQARPVHTYITWVCHCSEKLSSFIVQLLFGSFTDCDFTDIALLFLFKITWTLGEPGVFTRS